MAVEQNHLKRADNPPLRVLFIPQWYPIRDKHKTMGVPCQEHVRAAANYCDVAVLYYSSRDLRWPTLKWERLVDDGILTYCATYGKSFIPKTTRWVFPYQFKRAIHRVIKEWGRPDVIHTQAGYAYDVIKEAEHLGIPAVVSQHSGALLRGELDTAEQARYRWAFEHAAAVLPANQFAVDEYESHGIHAVVKWLPNTLDAAVFYPPSPSERESALLHVSSLDPVKRFPDIVRAFKQVVAQRPQAVLRVVGGRHHGAEMQALAARELPRGSYYFHGYLSKPEIAGLMRNACGFVFASESETFGCVLMEAMACACPVLTTRVGGIPAVVRDGEGLFFEVGKTDQLTNGMLRLIDGAHGLKTDHISQETRSRFSHQAIGRLLREIYLSALNDPAEAKVSRAS